ncbi:MAG: DUF1836 domain-containing protein [Lachnospiraceae bacterium]|nr:DUF1836 domain-containing protein [Lachnospiraceae bacterium]
MYYDKSLIAGKLRRWEKYMDSYRLPAWEDIPNIGLYMKQLTSMIKEYLDYLPPELKGEELITPAMVNNYVRKKIMPEPEEKKYYRKHIVFLIMICSLKQSLSIPTIQTMIPVDIADAKLKETYDSYVKQHQIAVRYFIQQVRLAAGGILDHKVNSVIATDQASELIMTSAVVGGFARLMAEKLLLLEGKTLENGGSIQIEERKK